MQIFQIFGALRRNVQKFESIDFCFLSKGVTGKMDSLTALQAEIAKKRKQRMLQSSSDGRPTKRWKSSAEIENERRKEYFARERTAVERRREVRERKLQGSHSQEKTSSPPSLRKKTQDDGTSETQRDVDVVVKRDNVQDPPSHVVSAEEPPLSKREVIKRLRSLKEPVTLFGETPWDRFGRMRELELAREEVSKGQKNVFQKKMRELEAKDAEDDMYRYTGAKLPQLEGDLAASKAEKEDIDESLVPSCKEDYVYMHLRKYMRLWSSEIEAMSKEEKRTKKGRSLKVTYEQTKDWLRPLYKLLRKRKLSRDILDGLNCIFEAAVEREYIRANSLYLERLAIGNAPWPMGATMVGIHARAAREKIGEDKIAHVMNDEKTRKYIQGVKRLLTVAQRHFPTHPSKMVG